MSQQVGIQQNGVEILTSLKIMSLLKLRRNNKKTCFINATTG